LLKKFRDTTRVQWTDVVAAQTAKCLHILKHLIDQVNDMVLSQEDQPRTHSTVRETSRKTSIHSYVICCLHKKRSAAEISGDMHKT